LPSPAATLIALLLVTDLLLHQPVCGKGDGCRPRQEQTEQDAELFLLTLRPSLPPGQKVYI
jgi:hypothetical protein